MVQRSKVYRDLSYGGRIIKQDKIGDLEIRIESVRQLLDKTKIELCDDDYAKHLKLNAYDKHCILRYNSTGKERMYYVENFLQPMLQYYLEQQ